MKTTKNQKDLFSVRKISVRNSGAGNGCANFMGAWKNAFFCRKNAFFHRTFLVLGGGGGVLWDFFGGGGGKCRFYFYGRGDFSEKTTKTTQAATKKELSAALAEITEPRK